MRNRLLIFAFALLSFNMTAQVFTVDTIAYNGNPNNRINLLIMGDGYMSSEMNTFRSDAQLVANYFFSVPPYSLYRNFFNVFGIEVVSNESGNDHPGNANDEGSGTQPVTSVDNYLQTTFDYGGTHRCIYSSQGSLVYSIANTNFPMYDFINVIVNTSYYGGCAGGIAYTSMNSSSPEVFVHEFGHMFGNLSDEYEYSDPCNAGVAQNINVTQVTDPNTIVWKNWLSTAPIPTPAGSYCNLIGAYEGAKYCSTNWYRPKCNCKMRSLNQPLCEVCTEQLIYKVSTYVNYIQSYTPANTATISLCKNSTLNFSANVLNSTNNTVRSQWFVDNVLVVNNNVSFTLDPVSLANGIHQVKLVTYDTTLQARKALSTYQVQWAVDVLPAPSAVATSNGTTFCSGQTLNLSASVTGAFSWTGPNNFSSTIQNPSISNLDSSNSGSYIVTASNSCGTVSSAVVVNVSSSINASITPQGTTSVCTGDILVLQTGNVSGYSYQWYYNSVMMNDSTNHSISVSQGGDYYVSVSIDSTSCSANSSTVTVVENPMPTAIISTTDSTTFCEGDVALLQGQTGVGYSYQWFKDNQPLVTGINSDWAASSSGSYTLVTTIGVCTDTSSSINISTRPSPNASLTLIGDTIFCTGGQINLSVPACTGCVYQWQKNLFDIGSANASSIDATESGSFRVEIRDTLNGCFVLSREVLVDVHVLPIANISASGPSNICSGDSLLLSVPFVSSYTYEWYKNGQLLTGSSSSALLVIDSGAYNIVVRDIVCSTQSVPFSVSLKSTPNVSMSGLADTICIYNNMIILTGSPVGGIFSGIGVSGNSLDPAAAGIGVHGISYSYTAGNGCTGSVTNDVFVDICLSRNSPDKAADFVIYPNPSSGMTTVQYSSNSSSQIHFNLNDVCGRLLRKLSDADPNASENSFVFNSRELSPGIYFLEMESDGVVQTKKLVVAQ